MSAAPEMPERPETAEDGPLLEVEHLKQHFPIKQGLLVDREVGRVHAVDDVTFSLAEGETLGLVGESGCGKTTLSRTVMRLLDPTSGRLRFRGQDITRAGRRDLRPLRREMQMVFQDPFASLNPRKRVGQIVGGPLRLHGVARQADAVQQLEHAAVGVGVPDAVAAQRHPDDLRDALARVQRRVGVLEDHLHVAPQRHQLAT